MALSADHYQLYAEFGIAAEKAQLLEVDAGNVALSYLAFFVKPGEISVKQSKVFRSVVDDLNRKTLGALLHHVKGLAKLDDSILKIVDEALGRRNYLTHRFFRTHNFAICSEDGRTKMIAELKEIQSTLELAHKTLYGIAEMLDRLAGRDLAAEETSGKLVMQGKRLVL